MTIYAVVVVLLHVPVVQSNLAHKSAELISQKLGTKVQIGSVSLGLLNRIILDDVLIEDQQKHQMLVCHRLSAKVDVIELINGCINISSAQIFGMNACLTKANAKAPLNCQFVLDSLASKDTTKHTPLDLHIASLIIRNSGVSYDQLDQPRQYGVFDTHHISIDKISSHIMLYALTDDSLSVRVKKIAFKELNSGLTLNRLSFDAQASKRAATLKSLSLVTDDSDLSIDADVKLKDKQITSLDIKSNHSSLSTNDIAVFVPKLKGINKTLFLDAFITSSNNNLNINRLSLSSSGRKLYFSMTGRAHSADNIIKSLSKPELLQWSANIEACHVANDYLADVLNSLHISSPILSRLGSVDYLAKANGVNNNIKFEGNITTAIGNVSHNAQYANNHLTASLKTSILNLGTLLDNDIIGDSQTELTASADVRSGGTFSLGNADVHASFPLLTVKGYTYRNVNINATKRNDRAEATLDISDLNLNSIIEVSASNIDALISGKSNDLRNLRVNANVKSISPNMLGLINSYPSTVFGADIKAVVDNINSPLDNINVSVENFNMHGVNKSLHVDNISLNADTKPGNWRNVDFTADFADIHAQGRFDYATLKNSLFNLVRQKLPTLPGLPVYANSDNNIQLTAYVSDNNLFRDLLGLELYIHDPIRIDGFINDRAEKTDMRLTTDSITLSGTKLDGTNLHIFTENDTLNIQAASMRRNTNGGHLALNLNGKAANNNLSTRIAVKSGGNDAFKGVLNATSQFYKNAEGASTAHVRIAKSELNIGDSLWHIHPSDIIYSANRLSVNNFLVEHGAQLVSIDGLATKSASDSLTVNLQDVNVAYIMNLVNFHSVEFSGYATGKAHVKSLFAAPDAYADLNVSDFRFENGRLGTLTVRGEWDNALGQINVKGQCNDHDVVPADISKERYATAASYIFDDDDNLTRDGRTDITGYISIKRNYIDLDVKARNTRLEFMQTYCDTFMDNVNAWASGNVRIWGDLSKINLTGDAVANGSVLITALNTTYTLDNDSVHFIPNDMIIERGDFYDKNGNKGVISGALHHRYLARMTFDLDVKAEHLLCFDFPTLNGEVFCGHVIGTGTCSMKGRPGEITFDIEAYPEDTSEITYNVSSPDALQNQEFITWRDKSTLQTVEVLQDRASIIAIDTLKHEREVPDEDFHTNIYLNFLIHATPASTLRLIMDERAGDYITFNGNGTLRATYYNKGGMQIFGNYNVERGEYKMTIQQVINKNFEFLPGGSLSFGGDPFEAAINLQAQYVVPSVPLSDLNIGNSFSNNTVRVNCLMNITGTAGQPQVEFDLNLPQASTDIQQMITSLMDGEEERNQQVLYLLSVGRFYAATNNATSEAGQSKASIAMQSFLSGTLSQQLNNIISNNILKNQNWNFGTNISPGDEGMNNAEYEGLISGRMFNNRLLVNGQFGYRDNANATTSFIGDFDVRYLLFPNGNLQVRIYNQSSDRYFTKANLNTQGLGIVFKHDFNNFIPYFLRKKTTKAK